MPHLVFGVLGAVFMALVISGAAAANPSLRNDAHIDAELFAVAVGDRIRRECPSISAKMLTVMSRARALEAYAKDQGHSADAIDAYLDSKADQERFKARARAYLAQNGAAKGDSEGHCRVGRAEIAAKSPIGTLLWSR